MLLTVIRDFFRTKRQAYVDKLAKNDIKNIVKLIRQHPESFTAKLLADELIVRILANADNEIGKIGTSELAELIRDGSLPAKYLISDHA